MHYKGKTIAEVLDMPIEEAADFFEAVPPIARHLQTLVDVGLGYVRLGQPAPTLSGGEAQRVKLAVGAAASARPAAPSTCSTSPPPDCTSRTSASCSACCSRLVDKGNTVIVIEHNLDVIKTADWVIDMGPEGGSGGGTVVAEGTPEDIAAVAASSHRPVPPPAAGSTGGAGSPSPARQEVRMSPSDAAAGADRTTRRGLLRGAAVLGAAGVVVGPLAACGSRTPSRSSGASAGSPTGAVGDRPTGPILRASDVPVGGGQVLTVAGTKVVVTQPVAGTFKAFSAVCTHQGCTVNSITDDVIRCPCHGAEFDGSTGAVIQGPATAPLATIPIAVQDGTVSFA